MNRRTRTRAPRRPGLERLEERQLLTTLFEGLAAGDLAGTTVAPLGEIYDDSTAGLVGEDFAIGAPLGAGGRGEVYIIFGGPHLVPQPAQQQGCISPPARVQSCTLINELLNPTVGGPRAALRIVGARPGSAGAPGDQLGFSIAGVGDVIGDSRPDILIGAPFALNSGGVSSGRSYLIGGDYIRQVISDARVTNTAAIIDLGTLPANCVGGALVTIQCFDGVSAGDQAGNSVTGLGNGYFAVSAPLFGSLPKEQRGAVYVFEPRRGITGGGSLTPISTVLGPSAGAHLGGIPAQELTTTGFRGSAISGIRNPALIPVGNEQPLFAERRYDAIGGGEPDMLVGAPDACRFTDQNTCPLTALDRPGLAYLLSGTALITIGGTYDLSDDADLKALSAIPVEGSMASDRLGSAVSGAGDLDGDLIDLNGDGFPDVGRSDFMFSSPNRRVQGSAPGSFINNAGEVYVVFGREVGPTNFPPGNCQDGVLNQNFQQCRDAGGAVVPIRAADFVVPGRVVGLTLRGDLEGERVGISLAEAGNYNDPVGRLALIRPSQVGVDDILIGAPFHDLTNPTTGQIIADEIGRGYVLFGSRDYRTVSGQVRNINTITATDLGQIFDGREAFGHYGSSVGSAGNAHDPLGVTGDDILFGANQIDVVLQGATRGNVGEVEFVPGSIGGAGAGFLPISPLPFIQPGPYGPQIFVPGYWSFVDEIPPAGSVVQFPLDPNQPSNGFLFPPGQSSQTPPWATGPYTAAIPFMGARFIPDKPTALIDRAGNLNVYGGAAVPAAGVNLTATLKSPKLNAGASLVSHSDGSSSIFAIDQSGHLVHHHVAPDGIYAVDLTAAASGATLVGNVSVQRVGSANDPNFIITGRTFSGDLIVYSGNDTTGWRSANLTQASGDGSAGTSLPLRGRGAVAMPSLSANYAINGSGHLIEYQQKKRGWVAMDVTALAGGPALQGDVSVNLAMGGRSRAVLEVFARGLDGHLIRYFREGRMWRAEDISAQLPGGSGAALSGSVLAANGLFGQRSILAQAGGKIVEYSTGFAGWQVQELPLPAGTSAIAGLLAVSSSGNTRTAYGYTSAGSLVHYRYDGAAWTSSVITANHPAAASGALATLLDMLADLGSLAR